MTQVTIGTYEEDGVKYRYLNCTEHAGNNEVCAAISGICYALTGYLINRVPDDKVEYELMSSHASISAKDSDLAREAFLMAEIGLRQIEQTYGDYIHVDVNL